MNIRALEPEVLNVPEPAFTKSWHPISHARLIETLSTVIEKEGLQIAEKHYSLSGSGDKVFGEWILTGSGDFRHMLGFRNSINKAFAIGLVAGLHIMNCANMVMQGDFIEFRKHTCGLDDISLLEMCRRAIGQVMDRFTKLTAWHQYLKEIQIKQRHTNYLIVEAMKRGALPPSRFEKFCTLFFEPDGRYYRKEPSLFDFHGAVTEVMNKDSLFGISKKNVALSTLMDDFKYLLIKNGFNGSRL